jgi:hypothetical protein
MYSIDDARDVRPFVTFHTWGLEKIFCRPHNSRYIAGFGGGFDRKLAMEETIAIE